MMFSNRSYFLNMSYFLLLILLLSSCLLPKEKGIKVSIHNQSGKPIYEVTCTTSENLEALTFELLEVGQNVSQFLSMEENQSDGSYILSFRRANGQKEVHDRGYYTNGGPLGTIIKFKILKDTVIANFSGVPY